MIELKIQVDTPEQLAVMLGQLTEVKAAEQIPVQQTEAVKSTKSPEPEKLEITLETVRAALTQVSEKHDLLKAKELLGQFGVKRISDLKAEQYPAFMQAAGEVLK